MVFLLIIVSIDMKSLERHSL